MCHYHSGGWSTHLIHAHCLQFYSSYSFMAVLVALCFSCHKMYRLQELQVVPSGYPSTELVIPGVSRFRHADAAARKNDQRCTMLRILWDAHSMLQAVSRHGRGANGSPGADRAARVAALGCACEESSGPSSPMFKLSQGASRSWFQAIEFIEFWPKVFFSPPNSSSKHPKNSKILGRIWLASAHTPSGHRNPGRPWRAISWAHRYDRWNLATCQQGQPGP